MLGVDRERLKPVLLWLTVARSALGIAAIPLAPFLYDEHFEVLVLLRPTKEVLLAAGYFLRVGEVALPVIVLAAIPLMIFGVWLVYYTARAYADELEADNLPRFARRLLPAQKISDLQEVLKKKGPKLVFLGRLAVFPSTVVAAAAGSSDTPSRKFLPPDGLGALLSIGEAVGIGYVLGGAYQSGSRWIAAVGAAILVGFLILLGRYLRRV